MADHPYIPTSSSYQQHELRRFKYAIAYIESAEFRCFGIAPKHECQFDSCAETYRHQIIQEIWGKQLSEVHERWPADWWQAVKEHFAPRLGRLGAWFLQRYPVRYRRLDFDAWALWPTIPDFEDKYGLTRIFVELRRQGVKVRPPAEEYGSFEAERCQVMIGSHRCTLMKGHPGSCYHSETGFIP